MTEISEATIRAYSADEVGRRAVYKQAWAAYEGAHPQSIEQRSGDPDDNVYLDMPALVVDTGVMTLYGQALKWDLPDTASVAAQDELDAFVGRDEDNSGKISAGEVPAARH